MTPPPVHAFPARRLPPGASPSPTRSSSAPSQPPPWPSGVVPLNAWIARAGAFAEAQQAIAQVLEVNGDRPAALAMAQVQQWLERAQQHAETQGRAPMTTAAEHLARKCIAAVRAAAQAWRSS